MTKAFQLSQSLTQQYPHIDYVFCNAGTTPQYELTHDGFEDAFGGMHLAHMALVLGLLPSLERPKLNDSIINDPSRIILVSSEMAINAAIGLFTKDHRLEELFSEGNLHGEITRGDGTLTNSIQAYGRAKLANVLFALELNRRFAAKVSDDIDEFDNGRKRRSVIAHAVHTGAVVTDSSRDSIQSMFAKQKWLHPGLGSLVGDLYFPLLWRPVSGGARVLLCAALSRDKVIVDGGQYLDALCNPFFSTKESNEKVLELIESGDIREDLRSIPLPFLPSRGVGEDEQQQQKRRSITIYIDAIQALQLADARWSTHLWNMSLKLLEQSPAKDVVALAP